MMECDIFPLFWRPQRPEFFASVCIYELKMVKKKQIFLSWNICKTERVIFTRMEIYLENTVK